MTDDVPHLSSDEGAAVVRALELARQAYVAHLNDCEECDRAKGKWCLRGDELKEELSVACNAPVRVHLLDKHEALRRLLLDRLQKMDEALYRPLTRGEDLAMVKLIEEMRELVQKILEAESSE